MSDLHLAESLRVLAFVAFAAILVTISNVDGAVASADGASPPHMTTREGAPRIALKLAPGARLTETSDGALTVIRDWASLSERNAGAGLPLETAGMIEGLGVTLLQPAAAAAFAAAGAAGVAGAAEDSDIDLAAAANSLRLMPGVLWAEVGSPVFACLTPNDPFYPVGSSSVGQWGVKRVGLPEAWDVTTGSDDIVVAVLDTGINPNIADFSGRIVSPYNVLNDSNVWPAWRDDSENGHGTAVAGVAAAQGNNAQGIAGAAWNVKIMPVKISDNGESDTVTLAEAIEYAASRGADVINVSFATPPGSAAGQTLRDAVQSAVNKGTLIVAAAGNWGATSVGYPAGLPGVIAVGATDDSDAKWTQENESSNTGSALDLAAPGGRIISYYKASGERFGYYGGTSMASPLVAGVAALVLSADPALTSEQITDILSDTADDLGESGWDREFGAGLLDAHEAVAQAAEGVSTTTTTAGTTTTTSPGTTTSTAPTTTTTLEPAGPRFADVTEDSTPYWYEIEYLAGRGVVQGFANGLFQPDDQIKRQQFAKMITLTVGCSVTSTDICPFTDVVRVPGELYPYHYVAVAYQCGFTDGTSANHFSPYRTLTRAQLVTMVVRAARLQEPPADYTPPFGNFSATHYPYARIAAFAGLLDSVVGMGPAYDFLAPASRAEVCLLLYALLLL